MGLGELVGGAAQQTAWSGTAKVYSSKDYHRLKTTKIFKKFVREGDSVLDVGCATGGFYEIARKSKISYTGIDITHESISEAKRKYPTVTFLEGDIRNLPFKDNSFDMVVCWDVLVHVVEYRLALQELCRVAKRNIIFTCQLWENGDVFGKQGQAPYNVFSIDNFVTFLEELAPSVRLIGEYGYMLPNVEVPRECKVNLNTIVVLDKTQSTPTDIKIRSRTLTLLKSRAHQMWLKIRGKI